MEGRLRRVRVVLVRPLHPGNVGAAARAIANHGLGGLALVDPPAFDPDRARWMAPGAGDVVDSALIVGAVEEAVADCALVVGATARRRRWDWPVWGPAELAEAIDRAPGDAPVAVLFGPEDMGLSNEDLGTCAAAVRLPTAPDRTSFNLAAAVAVLGAHLRAALPAAGATTAADRPPPAPAGLQVRVVDRALEALAAAGYLDGRSPEQVRGTLARLLHRAAPSDREVRALLGMADKLRHALRVRGLTAR